MRPTFWMLGPNLVVLFWKVLKILRGGRSGPLPREVGLSGLSSLACLALWIAILHHAFMPSFQLHGVQATIELALWICEPERIFSSLKLFFGCHDTKPTTVVWWKISSIGSWIGVPILGPLQFRFFFLLAVLQRVIDIQDVQAKLHVPATNCHASAAITDSYPWNSSQNKHLHNLLLATVFYYSNRKAIKTVNKNKKV